VLPTNVEHAQLTAGTVETMVKAVPDVLIPSSSKTLKQIQMLRSVLLQHVPMVLFGMNQPLIAPPALQDVPRVKMLRHAMPVQTLHLTAKVVLDGTRTPLTRIDVKPVTPRTAKSVMLTKKLARSVSWVTTSLTTLAW